MKAERTPICMVNKEKQGGEAIHSKYPTPERLRILLTLVRAHRKPTKREKYLGYSIAHTGSLIAMAFSIRRKHTVWNIGVDVVKMALPRNIQFHTYIDSLRHKVSLVVHRSSKIR
jgi:hypothetical protein